MASPQGKTAGRRTCYTIDAKQIHSIQESNSILEIDILDLYLWWTLTHPQEENFAFIFKPWHNSQQHTSFNILEICKINVWFQSWCRVHESQSISRWEESSDSNLPPIPRLSTTECGNCKWNGSTGEQPPKICNLSDLCDSDMQHQSLQSWDPSHLAFADLGAMIPKKNHVTPYKSKDNRKACLFYRIKFAFINFAYLHISWGQTPQDSKS